MKLTADSVQGNVVRSYAPGEIRLANTTLRSHVIISRDTVIADWNPAPLEAVSIADFAPALELQPEILLIGTGKAQRFLPMAVLTELLRAGIAVEVMETGAACRTFNVLIGEHRAAIAALLVE